jgi:hypothetical protein
MIADPIQQPQPILPVDRGIVVALQGRIRIHIMVPGRNMLLLTLATASTIQLTIRLDLIHLEVLLEVDRHKQVVLIPVVLTINPRLLLETIAIQMKDPGDIIEMTPWILSPTAA